MWLSVGRGSIHVRWRKFRSHAAERKRRFVRIQGLPGRGRACRRHRRDWIRPAVPFLILPGKARSCAFQKARQNRQRPSPLPPRRADIPCGRGPKPLPSPRPAPRRALSHLPGRALAFVPRAGPVRWGRGLWPGGETRRVSRSARNGASFFARPCAGFASGSLSGTTSGKPRPDRHRLLHRLSGLNATVTREP